MCPAKRETDLLPSLGERGVATISIDLQDAREAAEARLCPLAFAIGSVAIGTDNRRIPQLGEVRLSAAPPACVPRPRSQPFQRPVTSPLLVPFRSG